MALVIWAGTVGGELLLGHVDHAGLRHRQLACIKKGQFCNVAVPNCCGKMICENVTTAYGKCCLEEGVNGCSLDEHCCSGLTCDMAISTCIDPTYDPTGTSEPSEPRPCGIHGEFCVYNETDESNDCCGDIKYGCEEITVDGVSGSRCCMPVGGKGCSYTYHCCDNNETSCVDDCTFCDPVESRCVWLNGTFPEDAVGVADCSNEGGFCVNETQCCGDTRLTCQNSTCCILSGITGCDAMDKCCSGTCDFNTSTCCIPGGESGCVDHPECCPGNYCNSGTCTPAPTGI
eukprot:scaffold798_cov162-Amphora_coffeaeformis.AAC.8